MVTLTFISLILLFFFLDLYVFRKMERVDSAHQAAKKKIGASQQKDPNPPERENFSFPDDCYFDRGSTWAKPDGKGKILIGVNDVLQSAIGQVTKVDLPENEKKIDSDNWTLKITVGARHLFISSPVLGVVDAYNTELAKYPGLVNQDPYGGGWIFALKADNDAMEELKKLPKGNNAKDLISDKILEFDGFLQKYRKGQGIKDMMTGANCLVWNKFCDAFCNFELNNNKA